MLNFISTSTTYREPRVVKFSCYSDWAKKENMLFVQNRTATNKKQKSQTDTYS